MYIYIYNEVNNYYFFKLACDCNSVGSLDNFCDVTNGQCKCRAQTYGRVCDQCAPGSYNYPHCQRCVCHGHTDVCDAHTGACLNCQGFTEGKNCDKCVIIWKSIWYFD